VIINRELRGLYVSERHLSFPRMGSGNKIIVCEFFINRRSGSLLYLPSIYFSWQNFFTWKHFNNRTLLYRRQAVERFQSGLDPFEELIPDYNIDLIYSPKCDISYEMIPLFSIGLFFM